jgi:hypothetical protein
MRQTPRRNAPEFTRRGGGWLIALAFLVSCGSPPPRDAESLHALAITEPEFSQHVWPELPASRAERNLPFSYVWGDLRQKSGTRLSATLAAQGGQRYTLEEVRFSGETRSVFLVQGPDGPRELRLCGSMIEKDGRWKVFSYVVDD